MSAGSEIVGWARRLRSGIAALALSWTVGIGAYFLFVNLDAVPAAEGAAAGLRNPGGPIAAPDFGSALIAVAVWQAVFLSHSGGSAPNAEHTAEEFTSWSALTSMRPGQRPFRAPLSDCRRPQYSLGGRISRVPAPAIRRPASFYRGVTPSSEKRAPWSSATVAIRPYGWSIGSRVTEPPLAY